MIAGCLDPVGQGQPIAVRIIGIAEGDRRLMGRTGGGDVEQPLGLVVGHGQHAIRIHHGGQVAGEIIEVARHLAARQGLTEQLVHGIVGEADGLVLGRDSREQIVVPVIGIPLDLAKGIGGAEEPVPAVVGKGGGLILGVLHREQIAVAVSPYSCLTPFFLRVASNVFRV